MSKGVWTKVRKKGRGLNVEVEGRSWFEVYHNHQGSDDWHRWKRRQQAEHGRPGSTRKNLNLILRIRNFPSRKADAWKAGTLSLGGEVKFYSALQLCLTSPHPSSSWVSSLPLAVSNQDGHGLFQSRYLQDLPLPVWKPSEKVKGSVNRALPAPTIHSYVPGLQGPLLLSGHLRRQGRSSPQCTDYCSANAQMQP